MSRVNASPWLTVILPTYNGAAYVGQALESICAQDDHDIEVIALDDGSIDRTVDIVESYSNRLSIRLVRGQRRGSWVAGTNDGLRMAAAPYSCFLHQDDFWLPDRLRTMKALMKTAPGCSMYLHAAEFIDEKSRFLGYWTCPLPPDTPLDSNFVNSRLVVQCFTAINTPIFRTDTARECGMLDPKLWYTADWDFWMRMAGTGKTAYTTSVLSAFRVHSESLTVTGSRSLEDFREQLEAVAERWLEAELGQNEDVASRARLSVRLNVALARAYSGKGYGPLFSAICTLLVGGPMYWSRFFRDTRIKQRVAARVRAQLLGRL